MYINQLSQEKQDFIKSRLQSNLSEEGFEGVELAEAIQNALNSKLDDLDEHFTHAELESLKLQQATVKKGREGYSLRGDIVTVIRKVGACHLVQTEKGYQYHALPNAIELLGGESL